MKTLKESSKRLSNQYRFKRKLDSLYGISKAFVERDERVNRISPVKDIVILEPLAYNEILYEHKDILATNTIPQVRITKKDTKWAFRIEYIEQILDVKTLWVVVAQLQNENRTYHGSDTVVAHQYSSGISLDLIQIENPHIVIGDVHPVGHGRKRLYTEKELRNCEKNYYNAHSMIPGNHEPIWLEGSQPNQCIDIYLCNILPTNLTLYNATFYHRDVAHLYLESLSESLKRFVDAQSPYMR